MFRILNLVCLTFFVAFLSACNASVNGTGSGSKDANTDSSGGDSEDPANDSPIDNLEPSLPNGPTDIAIKQSYVLAISIKWSLVTEAEGGYIVERAGPNGKWKEVGRVAKGISEYLDNTVPRRVEVSYRIKAILAGGITSKPSRSVNSITAAAPALQDVATIVGLDANDGLISNIPQHTLQIQSTGTNAIDQYSSAIIARNQSCDQAEYAPWTPLTTDATVTLPSEGLYKLCLRGRRHSEPLTEWLQTSDVIYDITPPSPPTPFPVLGNYTNASNLSIQLVTANTVLAPESYSYKLYDSDSNCDESDFGPLTPMESKLEEPLVDGPYTLCVKARDAAGNQQATISEWKFTRDTIAPTAAVSGISEGSISTSPDVSLTVTSNDSDAFYGYAIVRSQSAGACAAATININTAVANSLELENLSDGYVKVCIKVSDLAGNITPTEISWTIDSTPPAFVVSGAPGAHSNSPSFNLTFTAPEADASYRYDMLTDKSDCSTATYGSWTLMTTPLSGAAGADGAKRLCIHLKDGLGNETMTPHQIAWSLDTTKPTAILTGAPSGITNTATLSIAVGPSHDVSSYRFALLTNAADCTSATFSDWQTVNTLITTAQGLDGSKRLCVQARDAAGNIQDDTTSATWTLDRVPPTASLSGAPSGSNSNGTLNVTVSSADAAEYRYALLTGVATCTGATYSNWVAIATPITSPTGDAGNKLLCVQARDSAGNLQTPVVMASWTKVASATTAMLSGLPAAHSQSQTLNVSVEPSTLVHSYRYAVVNGTNDCSSVSWSSWIAQAVNITDQIDADGVKSLCVEARDLSQNPIDDILMHSWTKDTTISVGFSNPSANGFLTGTTLNAYAFNGTCSDDGTSVTISGTFSASPTCNAGTWSHTLDLSSIGEGGTLAMTLTHTDQAGNTATASSTFTRDTLPPGSFNITTPIVTAPGSSPISWQSANGAAHYTVRIASDASCVNSVKELTNIANTSAKVGGLPTNTFHACVTAFDAAGNHIAASNNGVLFTAEASQGFVLGQPDASTIRRFAHGFNKPQLSTDGSRIFVADSGNHRVLIYHTMPTTNPATPDLVLGQPNINTAIENYGGLSLSSLNRPSSVSSDGTKLAVFDAGNHRILIWNSIPTSSNQLADVVIGQKDGASTSLAISMERFSNSEYNNVVLAEGKMFLTDQNRILIWNNIPNANDTPPDILIGQPNGYTVHTQPTSAYSFSNPASIVVHSGKVLVADRSRGRVLIWNSIPTTWNQPADVVVGKEDFTSTWIEGGGDSARTFSVSMIAIIGGDLWVGDSGSQRVLIFDGIPTTNYPAAKRVLFQPDFSSKAYKSTTSPGNYASNISGAAFLNGQVLLSDVSRNRLFLFNSVPSSNGAAPDLTIGGQYTQSAGWNYAAANMMLDVVGVATDQSHFYALQKTRVAVWNGMPTSDDQLPDLVIGRPDIMSTQSRFQVTPNSHDLANAVAIAAANGKLYVAMPDRIHVWNNVPSASGQPADFAIGSHSLDQTGRGTDPRSRFYEISDIMIHDDKLFVADKGASRVLIWNQIPTQFDTPADVVLGQENFENTTAYGGAGAPSRQGFSPSKLTLLAHQGKLFVGDGSANRVLVWNTIPTSNNSLPDLVLGQPNFTSNTINNGGISASSLGNVGALTSHNGRLYVSDLTNDRILVWDHFPKYSGQPADYVMGQSDFTSVDESRDPAQSYGGADLLFSDGLIISADNEKSRSRVRAVPEPTFSPQVSFRLPSILVNQGNMASFPLAGGCSYPGQAITFGGALSGSVTCASDRTWQANANLSAASDGTVIVSASHSDATPASISLQKNSAVALSITSPLNGATFDDSNQEPLTLTGTCSEAGQPVYVSGSWFPEFETSCTAGTWSASLKIGALPQGSFTVTASHADAVGDIAIVSYDYEKVGTMRVVITSPADGGYLNARKSQISGTCSVVGAKIRIDEGLSANTTVCQPDYTFTTPIYYNGSATSGTLTATMTDNGNTAVTSSRYNLDITPPTVASTDIKNLSQNINATFRFATEVSPTNASGIRYTVAATCPASLSTFQTHTLPHTGEVDVSTQGATFRICYQLVDLAGNWSTINGILFNKAKTALATPANLSASMSGNSVQISWSSVTSATHYLLVERTGTAPTWTPQHGVSYLVPNATNYWVAVSADTRVVQVTSTFITTDLPKDGITHYKLYSMASQWGEYSLPATLSPNLAPKELVTTVTGAPTTPSRQGSVQLAVSGPGISHYMAKAGKTASMCQDSSGYSAAAPAASPLLIDTAELGDGDIIVCVKGGEHATDFSDSSRRITEVKWTYDTTPPGVPGTLALAADGYERDRLRLSWTASAQSPSEYLIVRREGNAISWIPSSGVLYSPGTNLGDDQILINTISASATSFADNTVSSGITYHYALFARDAAGNYSAGAHVSGQLTTGPIAILTGAPVDSSIATSLNVTVGGSFVTKYRFKVGTATNTSSDCSVKSGYSTANNIAIPITASLASINTGSFASLCVIGGNDQNEWQAYSDATKVTWYRHNPDFKNYVLNLTFDQYQSTVNPSISVSTAPGTKTIHWKLMSSASCSGTPVYEYIRTENFPLGYFIAPPGVYYVCVTLKDVVGDTVDAANQPRLLYLDPAFPGTTTVSHDGSNRNPPTISWTASANATVYDFEFRTGNSCTSGTVIESQSGLTGLAYTLSSSITTGVTHVACVTPRNIRGASHRYAPLQVSINIDAVPPTAFNMTGPASTTNGQPTVTWSASSGQNGYNVIIDDEGTCTPPHVQFYHSIYSQSLIVERLLDGTYYACAEAFDTAGNVTRSTNALQFTSTALGTFSITGPELLPASGGALTWAASSGATGYDVYFADDAACTQNILTRRVTTTSAAAPNGPDAQVIYACVEAIDNNGNRKAATNNGWAMTYDSLSPAVLDKQVTVTDIGTAKVKLTFAQATDTVTATDQMRYYVVTSKEDNIGSLADIEANGSMQDDPVTGLGIAYASLLDDDTEYWFNIVAKDAAGNMTAYDSVSATTSKLHWIGSVAKPAAGWSPGAAANYSTLQGAFYTPNGVTSDDQNIYVADKFNNRIQRFSKQTGAYTGWIGTGSTTPPTGGASGCTSLANNTVTPGWCIGGTPNATSPISKEPTSVFYYDGDLYVTNAGRISRFDAETGEYGGWIGVINSKSGMTGICSTNGVANTMSPGWCFGGTSNQSTGYTGALFAPESLYVHDGYIYVTDPSSDRVSKYNALSGAFMGWIGTINSTSPAMSGDNCISPTAGASTPGWCIGGATRTSGTRLFDTPAGIVVSPDGYLYVADTFLDVILSFDAVTGARAAARDLPMNQVAHTAVKAGPTGLAVTDDNMLYVTANSRNYIGRFDLSDHSFTGWIGGIRSAPSAGDPGCSTALPGQTSPGWCLDGGSTIDSYEAGYLLAPLALSVDDSYIYVTEAGNNHRLQRFSISDGQTQGFIGNRLEPGIQPSTAVSELTAVTRVGGDYMSNSRGLIADEDYFYIYFQTHIGRFSRSDGTSAGWIGTIHTSPRAGAPGCLGASPDTQTPGWCIGGIPKSTTTTTTGGMTSFGTGKMAIDDTYLYIVESTLVKRYNKITGTYGGWIGRVGATAPSGGADNCTSTTNAATPGWCIGGVSSSTSAHGLVFSSATDAAVDRDNDYLYVAEVARVHRIQASTGQYRGWVGRITSTAMYRPTSPTACANAALSSTTPTWCDDGYSDINGTLHGQGISNAITSIALANGYIYLSDANSVTRLSLSDGSYQGWAGVVASTRPTSGVAGCTTAPVGSMTPGWCFGGGRANTYSGPIAVDANAIYIGTSTAVHKFTTDGIYIGGMGRLSSVPTGGDAGCRSLASGAAPRIFCQATFSSSSSQLGAFSSIKGLAFEDNTLFVLSESLTRLMILPNP